MQQTRNQPRIHLLKGSDQKEEDDVCCLVVQLPAKVYKKYANCKVRDTEAITEKLMEHLPYYSEITRIKRKNIMSSFEEVEYSRGGNILESQNEKGKNIYFIMKGEIQIYRRIPTLYQLSEQNREEIIKCNMPLNLF